MGGVEGRRTLSTGTAASAMWSATSTRMFSMLDVSGSSWRTCHRRSRDCTPSSRTSPRASTRSPGAESRGRDGLAVGRTKFHVRQGSHTRGLTPVREHRPATRTVPRTAAAASASTPRPAATLLRTHLTLGDRRPAFPLNGHLIDGTAIDRHRAASTRAALRCGASGAAKRPPGRVANVTPHPFPDPSLRLPPAATFRAMTLVHPQAELPPTGRHAINVPEPDPVPCALPAT